MIVTVRAASVLSTAEAQQVLNLVAQATADDGRSPLSEHVLLHLRHGGDEGSSHVLVTADTSELLGYAHLDATDLIQGPIAELVVHPGHRREGVGRALITELVARDSGSRLRLWAHGEQQGASFLATSMGFGKQRVLLQMRRSLHAPLDPVHWPAGITARAFMPGADDAKWLQINAEAFADHPEQGSWTARDLAQRMSEPWFDPRGFIVAERDGTMVGFHWTKVHGIGSSAHHHAPIGEVYVVGVAPGEQGTGLGRALTLAGLHHLRNLGLGQAMLFVDATNTAAIGLYTGLGFTNWDTDVLYRHRGVALR